MTCILHIDTTSNQQIKVGITRDGKEFMVETPLDKQKAQVVLPLIQTLLEEHHLQIGNITEIIVNPGPGSFTGLRVGLAIANALGFLLKVPVNGQPIDTFPQPVYK